MTLNAETRNQNTRRILDEINAAEEARKAADRITPDSRYPMLSVSEARFMKHVDMWGSASYPVKQTSAGRWIWFEFCGIEGAPTVYKSKTKASEAIEAYMSILHDKIAGRL